MSERGHDPFRQFVADALRKALGAATTSGTYPLSLKGRALAWLASSEATWWWETVDLSQSQALLRWGWIDHAREVLEEDERRARDPVAREPKSVGASHGTRGRTRLDPDTAALLREGIEYLTELQHRGRGVQQATRPFRPPTIQSEETPMGEMTDSTRALREAIRAEIEQDPQATAAELRAAVQEHHDVEVPGHSSFSGYHVPDVRSQLGWNWDPAAQRYVQRADEGDGPEPESDSGRDVDPEESGDVSEEAGEDDRPDPVPDSPTPQLQEDVDVPVVDRQTGEAVELDDEARAPTALPPEAASESQRTRATIDIRRNGKRYVAAQREDGRWDVHVEMDLPAEVAADLHSIAFAELFGLELD